MSHSVRRHLRVDIDAYDESIRRFIPGYEEMLRQASDAAAAVAPLLVLDLGAGTGAMSDALLSRPEVETVQLVDVDDEMLGQARTRLAHFGDRAQFTLSSFHEPLPECDAVVASLALHHIPSMDDKAGLYRRIFAALRPGGVFVNADVTMPAKEPERSRAWRSWADHLVASGIDEPQAWRHFEEWAEEDTYFPLGAELDALEGVGFRARCTWKDGVSTVVVADKPTRA